MQHYLMLVHSDLGVFLQKQTKQIVLKENAGCHHTENSVSIVLKYAFPAASTFALLFNCNIQRLRLEIKLV
jgi:hypothetical protein